MYLGIFVVFDIVIEIRLEVKMVKIVGFVIMFMVIIWVLVLVVEFVYVRRSYFCIIEKLDVVSVWLICSNGMINLVVYFLRNKDFCCVIWKFIFCKRIRFVSVLV